MTTTAKTPALTAIFRKVMLAELTYDMMNAEVYYSDILNNTGLNKYLLLLKQTLASGDAESLAHELIQQGLIKRVTKKHIGKGRFENRDVSDIDVTSLTKKEYEKYAKRATARIKANQVTYLTNGDVQIFELS